MIDLDDLEDHLKEIIDDGRGGERHTKAENVMALVQRLRQAEKDAARYREIAIDAHGILVASGDQEAANDDDV